MKRALLSLALVAGFFVVMSGAASAKAPHFGRMAFVHHTSPSYHHR